VVRAQRRVLWGVRCAVVLKAGEEGERGHRRCGWCWGGRGRKGPRCSDNVRPEAEWTRAQRGWCLIAFWGVRTRPCACVHVLLGYHVCRLAGWVWG